MPLGGLSALEAQGLIATEGLGVGKAQERKSSRMICAFDRWYERKARDGPAVVRGLNSLDHGLV